MYKEKELAEPILTESNSQWILFPIKHSELWNMYKLHVASFWTVEEIDLEGDLKDWNKLNSNEQHFIKMVLAFFASADGIVNENLAVNFYDEIKLAEARAFYSFQSAMETIHAETYSLLIQTYISNKNEQIRLFNAIENMDSIRGKANWAKQWMVRENSIYERLVAFACIEGILFSGSFAAIFWLRKRGLMPGLTFSNDLISRDEGLHTDFACALYKQFNFQLPQYVVSDIVMGAVEVEEAFICESLPCDLIGMNSSSMRHYIKFVADRLLSSLGYQKLY